MHITLRWSGAFGTHTTLRKLHDRQLSADDFYVVVPEGRQLTLFVDCLASLSVWPVYGTRDGLFGQAVRNLNIQMNMGNSIGTLLDRSPGDLRRTSENRRHPRDRPSNRDLLSTRSNSRRDFGAVSSHQSCADLRSAVGGLTPSPFQNPDLRT